MLDKGGSEKIPCTQHLALPLVKSYIASKGGAGSSPQAIQDNEHEEVFGQRIADESLEERILGLICLSKLDRHSPLVDKARGHSGKGFLQDNIEIPAANFNSSTANWSDPNIVTTASVEGEDGGINVTSWAPAATGMDNSRSIPLMPESQVPRLEGLAQEDEYLISLIEQGTPSQTRMDVLMRELAEQKRENEELLKKNALMQQKLALRGEQTVIDLDEVDDDEMTKSAAELNALAQELREVQNQVKEEPGDPSLNHLIMREKRDLCRPTSKDASRFCQQT